MSGWFPIGRDDSGGWRLDIVALLAVTGESFIGEHAQALTSSKLCLLPRIMPAPHALLQPRRPASLPRETAKVCGVHSGIVLDTLNFFANIIHPIDQVRPFAFKVLEIRHSHLLRRKKQKQHSAQLATVGGSGKTADGQAKATGVTFPDPEPGNAVPQGLRRRPTMKETVAEFASNAPTVLNAHEALNVELIPPDNLSDPSDKDELARVGAAFSSPLHLLTIVSFLITIGLVIAGALWEDGTALLAVGLASITTTTISFAARWKPYINGRPPSAAGPPGDIMIRTKEGAFLLIKCTEAVARELYSGVDECYYFVSGFKYRLLMTLSAAFLMPSVILLGNCSFNMQALVGAAYLSLNIAYWMIGLLPLRASWDLTRYDVRDITPEDARKADQVTDPEDLREGLPTYTRTLWFAIRETKEIEWAQRSGSYPATPEWDEWATRALDKARKQNRVWEAIKWKNEIMFNGTRRD
ncbi:hypothetical protein N657DRAFT_645241 [Parathielavia appendiculata]|uniref:Uncharacterized protein n=1 Tax=Parathielavia appendiculata TaxID=2587402 RepID=A0AAN6TZI9_9PEZI|nr:hypothetical protein N657DRAFT_645241 [Parathielavia appendiculata]